MEGTTERQPLAERLRYIPAAKNILSAVAMQALIAPRYETQKGLCQRFVRQVVQRAFGSYFDDLFKSDAKQTGEAFRAAGYGMPKGTEPREGDILYKLTGSGGHGHVGILIPRGFVAENSSAHWDGHDARGIRTLDDFGHYDLIVRLPQTYPGGRK